MKISRSTLKEIIREEIQKLNEKAPKPGMIKKVQAILQKELGGNIEVKTDGEGATFRSSGKDNGLYVDFHKHPLGDTFEIYAVRKDGFPTGGSAAHTDAGSAKDALKAVMMLAKKNKKLLQK